MHLLAKRQGLRQKQLYARNKVLMMSIIAELTSPIEYRLACNSDCLRSVWD